jgi:hypothetical protein
MSLLKHLSRAVSEPLKGADVKELASTLTVLANEKIKAEKAAEKGPTKSKGEDYVFNCTSARRSETGMQHQFLSSFCRFQQMDDWTWSFSSCFGH